MTTLELPTVEVPFEGALYTIDLSDIDALEWRALQQQAGLFARDVLDSLQKLDPYTVAALLWMRLRRDNAALEFEEVASKVTLASLSAAGGDPIPPGDAGS